MLPTDYHQNRESIEVLSSIRDGLGFYDQLRMGSDDLELLRRLVTTQWRDRCSSLLPELKSSIQHTNIEQYEKIPQLTTLHNVLWPKLNRILKPGDLEVFKSTAFFKRLKNIFGDFKIANEEGLYEEEAYWRLVRSNSKTDVGPLHADKWFWDMGHGHMPQHCHRVKIWVPLYCDIGNAGLCYIPESYKLDWPYDAVVKNGMTKPEIRNADLLPQANLFCGEPGNAFLFNDELIHGGSIGGNSTRVSLEFTLLVPESVYFMGYGK